MTTPHLDPQFAGKSTQELADEYYQLQALSGVGFERYAALEAELEWRGVWRRDEADE